MPSRDRIARLAGVLVFSAALLAATLPVATVHALSDIKDLAPEDAPLEDGLNPPKADEEMPVVEDGIPDPGPLIQTETPPANGDLSQIDPVTVYYEIDKAPEPVQRIHRLILEAAKTGDIENLRPLFERGANATLVSSADDTDDPILALKAVSGDEDGVEVLAILMDLLSTGYIIQDEGTPEEAYVWPYFVGKAINSLTPVEKVELLRIVTAGDVAGMQELGNYNFFRVGITADGRWKFFLTGD
ncbi:hypothetical protein FAA97_05935 [Peteryoungia ipomoeae]|uniref:Ankyrin repeat domain-containing protein n=2 Tax=Peteryoungia ipomoeae TaxID=1210932 RepID=A0A4S8P8G5_9HYPH|nr:hypothetical protein FAA97_05935 [Peteryoungia ipomoeae]